ncbi:MAG TPA: hypothetical protein VF647_16470 [Longimicrobium sp.]|jgi:hypothetical protein
MDDYDDYEPIDALRLKEELQARVSRELAGKTPEERVRWINEEGAKFWKEHPAPVSDEARKSA